MFRQCLPTSLVYDSYDEGVISRVMKMQETLQAGDEIATPGMEGGKNLKELLLVIDDCSAQKNALNTNTIRDVFMTGRHNKLTLILALQYLLDLSPAIRMNLDWVFVGNETNEQVRKRLHENFFAGAIPKFADFCKVMNNVTRDYRFLAFNNSSTADAESALYWFKAKLDPPTFHIGHRDFWYFDWRFAKKKTGADVKTVIKRAIETSGFGGSGGKEKEGKKEAMKSHKDGRIELSLEERQDEGSK